MPSARLQLQRRLQRICRLYPEVRVHARSFPVGSGNGIGDSYAWNTDDEVIVDAMRYSNMAATRGGLAHQGGAASGSDDGCNGNQPVDLGVWFNTLTLR